MVGWGGGLLSKLVGGRVGTLCRDCLACPRSREESGRSLCPKPSESGPASVPLTSVLHAAQSRCAHMQPPAWALDSPILQLPRLRLGPDTPGSPEGKNPNELFGQPDLFLPIFRGRS